MVKLFQRKQQSEESNLKRTPEQNLWVAVLSRAVEDVTKTSDWSEARNAINWVKRRGYDFREVCAMAGRNSDYVYEKLMPKVTAKEVEIDAYFDRIKKLQDLGIMRKYGERGEYKKRIRPTNPDQTQAHLQ